MIDPGTKQKALREAHGLLQKYGYGGFSFQHIADSLGIKKPSLYAHFESKEALGIDLIDAYRQNFLSWADALSELSAEAKIGAYFDMFFKFSVKGALYCPVAALSAELHALPASMRRKLRQMFDAQGQWLKKTIQDGQAQKLFRTDLNADELVEFIGALGLGGQSVARIAGEPEKIKVLKKNALGFLQLGADKMH